MYIAYTDIVFFRSEDRGKSWTYSAHGMADRNTVYELAIDPVHPNVMYAANAAQHDLPQFKMVKMDEKKFTGGVAKTTDGGLNWTMLGKNGGLPQGTCTPGEADALGMHHRFRRLQVHRRRREVAARRQGHGLACEERQRVADVHGKGRRDLRGHHEEY